MPLVLTHHSLAPVGRRNVFIPQWLILAAPFKTTAIPPPNRNLSRFGHWASLRFRACCSVSHFVLSVDVLEMAWVISLFLVTDEAVQAFKAFLLKEKHFCQLLKFCGFLLRPVLKVMQPGKQLVNLQLWQKQLFSLKATPDFPKCTVALQAGCGMTPCMLGPPFLPAGLAWDVLLCSCGPPAFWGCLEQSQKIIFSQKSPDHLLLAPPCYVPCCHLSLYLQQFDVALLCPQRLVALGPARPAGSSLKMCFTDILGQ